MVSTYPPTTDTHEARYARMHGGLADPITKPDGPCPSDAIGEASPWWLRRVQHDAEVLESFLLKLAEANRAPMALGGISREFRRFADRNAEIERMSRDRLYGALVLLALRGRVHIYGDATDHTMNPTFQVLTGMAGTHLMEQGA